MKCAVFVMAMLIGCPGLAQGFWPFVPTPQIESNIAPLPAVVPAPVAIPVKARDARSLQGQVRQMAETLFSNLAEPDPENGDLADGIVVCTFVDLKKLYRTSSLGRYLAEQMMTEMQQHRYSVLELRKSRSIMVQEKRGEYGLSRDPAEVAETMSVGAMLTGTYTAVKDDVIINAKIVDNRSSKLLSAATIIIPRNELAEYLLSDSVTARVRKAEPIYMKRLEL
jgi:TolB-like protein